MFINGLRKGFHVFRWLHPVARIKYWRMEHDRQWRKAGRKPMYHLKLREIIAGEAGEELRKYTRLGEQVFSDEQRDSHYRTEKVKSVKQEDTDLQVVTSFNKPDVTVVGPFRPIVIASHEQARAAQAELDTLPTMEKHLDGKTVEVKKNALRAAALRLALSEWKKGELDKVLSSAKKSLTKLTVKDRTGQNEKNKEFSAKVNPKPDTKSRVAATPIPTASPPTPAQAEGCSRCGTFPRWFDSVQIAAADLCPLLWALRHVYHRKQEPDVKLAFGIALAKGLECWRTSAVSGREEPEDRTMAVQTAVSTFSELVAVLPEDKTRNEVTLRMALERYMQVYADDEIASFNSGPMIEWPFEVPTQVTHPENGRPIVITGRMDCVVVIRDQLWVVDEKTTTMDLSEYFFDSFSLRPQTQGYLMALAKAIKPFGMGWNDIGGYIIRGIRIKPASKKPTKKGGSLLARTPAERVLVDHHFYSANIINVKEWWYKVQWRINELKAAYEKGRFPMNTGDHCHRQFGRPCQFLPYCKVSHSKDIVTDASASVEHHEWDPFPDRVKL